jgi:hypothetical protein
MRRRLLIPVLVALSGCTVLDRPIQSSHPPDAATDTALKGLRQDLQSALAHGDRAALEHLLDPSFVFVHSTGKLEPRAAFIERMAAAGALHAAPEIDFVDDDIRLYGNTAVWITHSVRHGTSMSFVGTDVLVKGPDGWKWVSVQSTRTDH